MARIIVLAGLAMAIAATAHAQPTLMVRADSRIEVEVRRADDGLTVRGALRDDLGVPLAGEEVTLELSRAIASEHRRGPHVAVTTRTTRDDGSFSTRFVVEHGDYVVDATFEGGAEHLGTRATRFFDLDRAHVDVRLAIEDGARIDLSVPTHVLTVSAESEVGGDSLGVTITDETGAVDLGHGTTDADGVLQVAIESARLGPPAAGRIVVRTDGDARRAEAQSELPVVRYRPTRTTLDLSGGTVEAGGGVDARGTLDDGVAPIEREAISIVAGERVLATVLTDESGEYHARLDSQSVDGLEGDISVVARFDGAAPWVPGSESAPRTLRVARPLALGWLWPLVPVLLASLVVAWSLRRDPIARVREKRPEGAAGVSLGARRGLVATRLEVSGRLVDAVSGEPIADATIRGGSIDATTAADGSFALSPSRDASALAIEHPEYVALTVALTLPHRGEHDGMIVRIASRRALSFAALREVATELAPDGELALSLTQREVLELMRARGSSPPALPDLVSRVEIACYAALPPTDADLAHIRGAATAIVSSAPRSAAR